MHLFGIYNHCMFKDLVDHDFELNIQQITA